VYESEGHEHTGEAVEEAPDGIAPEWDAGQAHHSRGGDLRLRRHNGVHHERRDGKRADQLGVETSPAVVGPLRLSSLTDAVPQGPLPGPGIVHDL